MFNDQALSLNPSFDPRTYQYSVALPSGVTEGTIVATKNAGSLWGDADSAYTGRSAAFFEYFRMENGTVARTTGNKSPESDTDPVFNIDFKFNNSAIMQIKVNISVKIGSSTRTYDVAINRAQI